MSKKIILTGGGTAGHVTPNIALIPHLKEAGYEIVYIGSYDGIEKKLISDFPEIRYYGIATGKFRRYLDLKNLTDPFRVIKGYAEAKKILKKEKPDVLFSKGGFVSVPVVRAAASLGIPCIIHESDMTPGLANRLCIPIARKVCCNFPETLKMLPEEKADFVKRERAAGRKVIMVGDGINDSPALSAADVGIAISDGAQIAREIADITIEADNLSGLLTLRAISCGLLERIRKNYIRIVGINSGLILLGITGRIQPTSSAMAHNVSTLMIGLNSMRNLVDER